MTGTRSQIRGTDHYIVQLDSIGRSEDVTPGLLSFFTTRAFCAHLLNEGDTSRNGQGPRSLRRIEIAIA